ncbi:MAG TPA: DCC1-like thiol-disulfide oxidoreductase family protein [Acidimicrobiales bacterium]|nr:DCC1-like thiol-disulfide oxidoreductase family protein [Acidimicrobiales bacterium]
MAATDPAATDPAATEPAPATPPTPAPAATPAATPSAVRPVFLYDGDCAFCTTCAHFIERRIPTTAAVRPWQFADLDALGVTQAAAEDAVQWVAPGHPAVAGPVAIARLLVDAGSFWRPLGWVLGCAPVRWVAWPLYRLIARNRHRLPGGTAACSLPQAERDRRRAG